METNLYPLRSLFSVKYYFDELSYKQRNGTEENDTSGVTGLVDFDYRDTQNSFNIYENENYIPMGFAFDYYATDDDVSSESSVNKTHMLLKALILDDEQAEKYSDVISRYYFVKEDFTADEYRQNCADRKAESCSSFSYDSYGFNGEITLDSPKLVFFSVPYDKGWSAEVNGQAVDIEKVDYGFMAVLCPAGTSSITFKYETYGIKYGEIITVTGVAALVVYVGYWWYDDRKKYKKYKKTEVKENVSGK
jgi:hypothetical protein